jgi:O-antigen/teichoic acid export membrane protein
MVVMPDRVSFRLWIAGVGQGLLARGGLSHMAGSALGATLAFVFLRAVLTPIRIKVVTSLLEPETYGAVTLLSMTAHGLALIVSLGGFETLLRRLPATHGAEKERIYGGVLGSSSFCGLFAILVLVVLWGRIPVFKEMAVYVSPWAAGLLVWMFLHIHQRMYWLLGCRRYWMARLTQLFWSDLWFLPLLILIPFGLLQAEGIVLTWSIWLAVVSLLTWRSVPIFRALCGLAGHRAPIDLWLSGMPLIPVILGEWIFRLSGHYVLLAHVGAADMAFYALSLNVALVGLIAATPLVDICIVELSHAAPDAPQASISSPSRDARRVVSLGVRHLVAVLMPAAFVMIIMPEEIIRFLAAESFLPAARYVPFAAAMPALLALNLLFARLLMLFDHRRAVITGSLGAALGSILLCFVLVPVYGVYGALSAIIVSCTAVDIGFAFTLKIWRWLEPQEFGIGAVFAALVILGVGIFSISLLPYAGIIRLLLAGLLALFVVPGFRLLRLSDFYGGPLGGQTEG